MSTTVEDGALAVLAGEPPRKSVELIEMDGEPGRVKARFPTGW